MMPQMLRIAKRWFGFRRTLTGAGEQAGSRSEGVRRGVRATARRLRVGLRVGLGLGGGRRPPGGRLPPSLFSLFDMSIFTAILQRNLPLFYESLHEPGAVTARLPDGQTALMVAASLGQADLLDHLLTAGADISAEDIVRFCTWLLLRAPSLPLPPPNTSYFPASKPRFHACSCA